MFSKLLNEFLSLHLTHKNVPIVIYKRVLMGVFKIFRNVQNILLKDELITSTLKLTFQGQCVV